MMVMPQRRCGCFDTWWAGRPQATRGEFRPTVHALLAVWGPATVPFWLPGPIFSMYSSFRTVARMCSFSVLWAGCFLNAEGDRPPPGRVNLPVATVLSAPVDGVSGFVYLVNSNFDLRFNAGTVMSFDLNALGERIPDDCFDCVVNPADVLAADGEVLIGSNASSAALSLNGQRLFVAVRSNSDLTTVETDPNTGSLTCGGTGRHTCRDDFTATGGGVAEVRGERLPPEPVAVAVVDAPATADTEFVLTAHRGGAVALFSHGRSDPSTPSLLDVQGAISAGVVNFRYVPAGDEVLVFNERSGRITQVGLARDNGSVDGSRLFLQRSFLVSGVIESVDYRDAYVPEDGNRIYLLSRKADGSVFRRSRQPDAVLETELDRDRSLLRVLRSTPVSPGPSRMVSATFSVNGEARVLLFVSCFNAREIQVVDVKTMEVLGAVRGLSGPFSMTVDVARARVYVSDFRASVLRVVGLRQLLECLALSEGATTCELRNLGLIGDEDPVAELL